MKQMTFAELEYAHKKRKTRREIFLVKLEDVIPWKQLIQVISKHYTKNSKTVDKIKCGELFRGSLLFVHPY